MHIDKCFSYEKPDGGYPAPVEKQQSGQIIDLPAEHSTRGAYLGQTKWELCRYYSYYSYYNITTSALGSIFIDFVDCFYSANSAFACGFD